MRLTLRFDTDGTDSQYRDEDYTDPRLAIRRVIEIYNLDRRKLRAHQMEGGEELRGVFYDAEAQPYAALVAEFMNTVVNSEGNPPKKLTPARLRELRDQYEAIVEQR